jgi:hypothetical protein
MARSNENIGALVQILGGAPEDKKKKWCWKGLEKFVNRGDSIKDYADLSKAWPTFWPVNIRVRDSDAAGSKKVSLNWHEDAALVVARAASRARRQYSRPLQTVPNVSTVNAVCEGLPNVACHCFYSRF